MVSHLFYSQLALCVLVWLFVMLHVTGAHPGLPASPATAQPTRKRSTEPKAFAGLTQQPHCVLCEQEINETAPAPPRRPDPLPLTHRRPRTVDPSQPFCPHPRLGRSRLAGAAQPVGQWSSQWRPLAAVALPRVRRLCSRASWHDFSWPAGGGEADRARAGLLG
jgi:hypothetical protein